MSSRTSPHLMTDKNECINTPATLPISHPLLLSLFTPLLVFSRIASEHLNLYFQDALLGEPKVRQ